MTHVTSILDISVHIPVYSSFNCTAKPFFNEIPRTYNNFSLKNTKPLFAVNLKSLKV